MPITLRQLCATEQFGLRVLAGHDQLDRTLTWAHVSELPDPTPFLDGGELLLITGVSLPTTAAETTRFVRTLVAAGIAGIGSEPASDTSRRHRLWWMRPPVSVCPFSTSHCEHLSSP